MVGARQRSDLARNHERLLDVVWRSRLRTDYDGRSGTNSGAPCLVRDPGGHVSSTSRANREPGDMSGLPADAATEDAAVRWLLSC